jgi:hypothetical protein
MVSKQIVRLPPDVIERCERHGQRIVENYRIGRNRGSLALSSHGAQNNPIVQAEGKMYECAFALWGGLHIEQDVNWSGYSDPGYDFEINGSRFDIKGTRETGKYLIWPVNKRRLLQNEPFHFLVLVRGRPPIFEICGFISKQGFLSCYCEATENSCLTPGTWFVHVDRLKPATRLLSELRNGPLQICRAIIKGEGYGHVRP